jgi:hypothetical protein
MFNMKRQRLVALGWITIWLLSTAFGASKADEEVSRALAWLRGQQLEDGGFSNGFSEGSDIGTSAEAVLAAVSGEEDPSAWAAGGKTPLDFLEAAVAGLESPGLAAKTVLAVKAAGLDPRAFGGVDLVARVLGGYSEETQLFGAGPFDSGLAILALSAVDEPLPQDAMPGLLSKRLLDGSFSFSGDMTPGSGDSNTTAVVVQAILAAGLEEEAESSVAYFRSTQNADRGWTYQKPSAFGEATDVNSTALVIQALLAAREDLQDWGDPQSTLKSFQLESGAFAFNEAMPDENILATVQAIPALAGFDTLEVARTMNSEAPGPAMDSTLLIGTLVVLVLILAGVAWRERGRARTST